MSYRTISGYLDAVAAAWEQEAGPDKRDETWHPEDAMDQIVPFATAFLLGWSVGIREDQ